MKKILFVTNKMITGGVEKALINLLKKLDPNEFDVTLLIMRNKGILEDQIPKYVQIYHCDALNEPKKYLKRLVKRGHLLMALKKAVLYFGAIKANSYWEENILLSRYLPKIEEKFDSVIAYHAPGSLPVHFVINNTKSHNKIIFIHGDIEKTKCNGVRYTNLYSQYNKIVCVSKEAMKVFLKHNFLLQDRTKMIYNIINYKDIIDCSKDNIKLKIDICTVARLSKEKGIDIAVETCKILVESGFSIKWYVCGTGEEQSKLQELITEYRLDNNFILLGDVDNPYPYIKNCNIYVQTSRNEGYCLTLAEARVLCKPIVTTNFVGAKEQIKNRLTGTIVSINPSVIAEAITELMNNTALRESYQTNLQEEMNEVKNEQDSITELISIL